MYVTRVKFVATSTSMALCVCCDDVHYAHGLSALPYRIVPSLLAFIRHMRNAWRCMADFVLVFVVLCHDEPAV